MDYKNKHREEIARATQLWKCGNITRENLEYIFPELKKSDDQRIRKDLIIYLRSTLSNKKYGDKFIEDWIAWLEAQGEQKSANKIEQTFHEGDWITNGQLTCKVLSVTNKSYELHLYNDDYCHFETDVQSVDKYYHLWTIKDAKDGDVLSFNNNGGCIICKCPTDDETYSYCRYENNSFVYKEKWGWRTESLVPATKEQREQLFKAMHEAGYEWDANKKKLKKIEQQQWKPSKEQIIALRWVLNNILYNKHKEEISGLIDQIKVL